MEQNVNAQPYPVTPEMLTEILIGCYKERKPKLFVAGSPGTGKTSIVYQVAKTLGIPVFNFQATLYDPTEIKGLPIYDHDKNVARFLPFEDMPSRKEGLLVIDDLTHAPTQTQNAFMRLVLEGEAGAWKLNGLFPVATGNRAKDRAGAKDLQTALAGRFCIVELEVDYKDWRKWAIDAGIHPSIIAFLGTPDGGQWLDKFNSSQQINPTPRSWEHASDVMNCLSGTSMKAALFGCVGVEAGLQFTAWMKYYDKMPDLQKIIAGKNIYPDDLDVMYATVSGLIALTKKFPKKESIVQRLIDYSVEMPDKFVELGALLSKDLLNVAGQDSFVNADLGKWSDRYPDLIV